MIPVCDPDAMLQALGCPDPVLWVRGGWRALSPGPEVQWHDLKAMPRDVEYAKWKLNGSITAGEALRALLSPTDMQAGDGRWHYYETSDWHPGKRFNEQPVADRDAALDLVRAHGVATCGGAVVVAPDGTLIAPVNVAPVRSAYNAGLNVAANTTPKTGIFSIIAQSAEGTSPNQ